MISEPKCKELWNFFISEILNVFDTLIFILFVYCK